MSLALRDYQRAAISGIYRSMRESPATLAVLATGTGKTVVFSHVADACVKRGKRVILVVHRDELVWQAAEKLKTVTGSEPDVEMAEFRADRSAFHKAPVVVASVQTLATGRIEKFDPAAFGLLIADEAHHSTAATWKRAIDYFRRNERLKVLGVTATPDRADEEALGQIFASVAFEYGVAEAVRDGWLVPIRQRMVFVEGLDFSKVKTTAGDLNAGDLAAIMEYEETLHRMVNPTLEIVGQRRTLIFAASVAHAERMAEIINRHKDGQAQVVTGGTPRDQRRQMFKDYGAGKFQFLVNVGVVTEGVDVPGIECVVMGRPTKSRSLFSQMLGRGTRPLPGLVDGLGTAADRRRAINVSAKPAMLVVDFVGNSGRHKLVHAADVLAGKVSEGATERASREAEKSEQEEDVLEGLAKAEADIVREQSEAEARRRRHIRASSVQYSMVEVSPFDVLQVAPPRVPGWHKGRMATEKQANALRKFAIPDAERLGFCEASRLLDTLIGKLKAGENVRAWVRAQYRRAAV